MSNAACQATRRDGNRCGATPTASGYCFAHDPELRKRTADGRRKGGVNRATATRAAKLPADMKALASQLMEAISECYAGDLEPKRLTAMASGASAIVRVHEVGELEQRLEALEARADQAGQQRRAW